MRCGGEPNSTSTTYSWKCSERLRQRTLFSTRGHGRVFEYTLLLEDSGTAYLPHAEPVHHREELACRPRPISA